MSDTNDDDFLDESLEEGEEEGDESDPVAEALLGLTDAVGDFLTKARGVKKASELNPLLDALAEAHTEAQAVINEYIELTDEEAEGDN